MLRHRDEGPAVEISLHGREGWEMPWQLSPLASGHDNIENGFDDTTRVRAPGKALNGLSQPAADSQVQSLSIGKIPIIKKERP